MPNGPCPPDSRHNFALLYFAGPRQPLYHTAVEIDFILSFNLSCLPNNIVGAIVEATRSRSWRPTNERSGGVRWSVVCTMRVRSLDKHPFRSKSLLMSKSSGFTFALVLAQPSLLTKFHMDDG